MAFTNNEKMFCFSVKEENFKRGDKPVYCAHIGTSYKYNGEYRTDFNGFVYFTSDEPLTVDLLKHTYVTFGKVSTSVNTKDGKTYYNFWGYKPTFSNNL